MLSIWPRAEQKKNEAEINPLRFLFRLLQP
nr:MAG TPA: hypothetical protein [Caudoviricetes sp.]